MIKIYYTKIFTIQYNPLTIPLAVAVGEEIIQHSKIEGERRYFYEIANAISSSPSYTRKIAKEPYTKDTVEGDKSTSYPGMRYWRRFSHVNK